LVNPTKQSDKILSIWDEHLQVAKTLTGLAASVSDAVDLIYAHCLRAVSYFVPAMGAQRRMRSISLQNLPAGSSWSENRSERWRFTAIRRLSPQSETIMDTNWCSLGSSRARSPQRRLACNYHQRQ